MGKKINWKKKILEQQEIYKGKIISNLDNIKTRDMRIEFICNCGTNHNKTIRSIVDKSGLLCHKCTYKISLRNRKKTNLTKFGVEFPIQSENIQNKLQATNMEKYGVANVMHSKKHKNRQQLSVEKNYGVKNPSQSNKVKDKKKKTMLKNYGVEFGLQNKEIQNKLKQTNLERYGFEYANKNEIIKNRIKDLFFKKYGVYNPMHVEEFFKKCNSSGFTKKEYEFNTGEIVKIQGYEHFALDLLQEQGYTFNDIQIEKLKIKYKLNNKNHYHYPDIYIKKENLIIEVKSIWTYYKELEKNIQKQLSCIEQGFKYEFWVFDNKRELIII